MPTFRPLVLAAALALVAVGCGSDDDGADATTTTTTTTSSTTSGEAGTPSEPDDPTTSSTTTEPEGPTTTTEGGEAPSGDLFALLLTPEDLPPGFTAEDEEPGSSGMTDSSGLCGGEPAGTFTDPEEQAERELSSDDQSIILSALAGRWSGTGAADTIALYRSEAERCPATEGAEGFTLEEVDGVGDEAVMLVITFDGEPAGTIWLARVDDVLLGLSILGEGEGIDGRELLEVMVSRA